MKLVFCRTDIIAALVFGVGIISANLLLKHVTFDPALRFAVALLPVPGFFVMLAGMMRVYRKIDEMQQRITLEVLAHVFALTMLGAMTLYMLQKAGFLLEWDYFGDVLPYAVILGYAVGYWNTSRRYR